MRSASLGLVLAASACSPSDSLPDDFAFGTAVAGFQVDMGCPTIPAERCEDRRSDWYHFVTSTVTRARSGNHLAGDPVSDGPGFYELYAEDLARAKALGLTHFRFSFEWSRLFPNDPRPTTAAAELAAKASPDAVAYYHALLDRVRAEGLEPLATIHHYTLPAWIHDAVGCNVNLDTCSPRGWLEPDLVPSLAAFGGYLAAEFGAEVDRWATLNEPLAVVLPGFLLPSPDRTNPPAQLLRPAEAKVAFFHMIEAHHRLIRAVRDHDTTDADGDGRPVEIGLVFPVAPIRPVDPDRPEDQLGARNLDYLYNRVFLDGALKGDYDEALDGTQVHDPSRYEPSDYLGLNYYFAVDVVGDSESVLPDFSPKLTINPLGLKAGARYPEGLADVLETVGPRYGLPIYITENGSTPDMDGGQERFLLEHLSSVLRAVRKGVDVRGYFWWSLVDNYEWNHGMGMRFGLFGLTPGDATKARTERPVAGLYREIATERRLRPELFTARGLAAPEW